MSTGIALISLALAFVCFGLMDELAHHFDQITVKWIRSNPQFWDKRLSWMNKWENTLHQREKFWGSSRWFVFLTDGWHLVQFIAYQFLSISGALLFTPVIWKALLLSMAVHVLASTIKSITMKLLT